VNRGGPGAIPIQERIFRFRFAPFDRLRTGFDTSGRTGLTARAEVSKREHVAELTLRKRNI
jgi:hypothetical protein